MNTLVKWGRYGLWFFCLLVLLATRAQPLDAAPLSGGTFTVNSLNDDTDRDDVLTLREAILIADGGTDVSGGLGRNLTDGEMAQLSGCQAAHDSDGYWSINANCGKAVADKIVFASSLGYKAIIVLGSDLPEIFDAAPTTIDGNVNGVQPILDAGDSNTISLYLSGI